MFTIPNIAPRIHSDNALMYFKWSSYFSLIYYFLVVITGFIVGFKTENLTIFLLSYLPPCFTCKRSPKFGLAHPWYFYLSFDPPPAGYLLSWSKRRGQFGGLWTMRLEAPLHSLCFFFFFTIWVSWFINSRRWPCFRRNIRGMGFSDRALTSRTLIIFLSEPCSGTDLGLLLPRISGKHWSFIASQTILKWPVISLVEVILQISLLWTWSQQTRELCVS